MFTVTIWMLWALVGAAAWVVARRRARAKAAGAPAYANPRRRAREV